MIHELVVTSAARGLQSGRSGFTTVLRTRGIHPELQAKLEQGSAYRHVYPQGDARNPRILSHALLQSPAGRVSVLSSIVDAGNGYDGRSNKLAHHLALDGGEVSARAASSPAGVLLAFDRGGGFLRRWSGQPREQAEAPQLPAAPACEPGPCGGWARAAGDAGWAGFIVDRALRREQTWIVAGPDCDLAQLFAEALALAPPAQRWGVTFTTYAVGQPDVLWLGTVDGAPEAQSARGQSRVAVVDLVRRPSLTATSPLVEAARGNAPVPWLAEPCAPAGPGAAAPAAPAASAPGRPPRLAGRPGAPPPLANPFAFSTTTDGQPRAAPEPGSSRGRRRSWIPVLVVAVATAAVAALVALAIPAVRQVFFAAGHDGNPRRGGSRPASQTAAAESATKPANGSPATDRTPRGPAAGQSPSTGVTRPEVGIRPDASAEPPAAAVGGAPGGRAPFPPPPPPPPPPPGPPPVAADAFPNLRAALDRADHLPLEGLDGDDPREREVRLCVLHGARVIPRLPDAAFALNLEGGQARVACVPDADGGWRIVCAPSGAGTDPRPFDVGRVDVRDGTLHASLGQRVAPNDPRFTEQVAARAAVATAILILSDAGRSGETTFVQLCRPAAGGPLVVEQFFFDDKLRPHSAKHSPVKLFLGASLPSTPWPCQVRLGGASVAGDVVGGIASSAPGRPSHPSGEMREPASWSTEWSMPGGEPFMRTELRLAAKDVPETGVDPCDTQFWLWSSDVLEPWSTFRYCADLNQAAPPRIAMHQLPRASLLKIGTEVPADSDQAEVDLDLIRKFSGKVCRQYPRAPSDIGRLGPEGRQPVSLWKERIRGLLGESAEFRAWAEGGGPDAPADASGPPGPQRRPATAGPPAAEVVASYWAHLKAGEDRLKTTHPDVWSCCLLEELDTVPAHKQEARNLITGLGEGDAEFRGDITIDFGGRKCLLVSLGEKARGYVSSRKPVPSGQREPPKAPRPSAAEDKADLPPPDER